MLILRYLLTAKSVDKKLITIPRTIINRYRIVSRIMSSNTCSSGNCLFPRYTIPLSSDIANVPLSTPCRTAVLRNGDRINRSVAPTSFIVLIVNRFEYIASRIVLLINTSDMKNSVMAKPSIMKLILRIFSFTNEIRFF